MTDRLYLAHKLRDVFGSEVVDKSIVRDAGLPRMPQFVVEHLVANHDYVDGAQVQQDLSAMRERMAQIMPSADNREELKARLMRDGELIIVDQLSVQANLHSNALVGTLSFLGEDKVALLDDVIRNHPRLLTGGLWGAHRLSYRSERLSPRGAKLRHMVVVKGVLPFQSAAPDMDEFASKRARFTTQEWIDILMASVGYEPSQYDERTKLLLLMRLLPAIEANYNAVELGPRQTGKTYLLRNLSPSVYTASGANLSVASLFANASTGALGILASYKTVVLDEIADTKFDSVTTVAMLKDYMESGEFTRAGRKYAEDSSVVLTGNLEVDGNRPAEHYRHLFEALPKDLQDTAFLDRVHAYLPGWEIPKIGPHSISQGYGLVVDYLGQVFTKLRERSRRGVLHDSRMVAQSGVTRRDVVAMEKTVSGLMKLVYPHDRFTKTDLAAVVAVAAEMRQRVNSQLAVMAPGEFQAQPLLDVDGWRCQI